ncbi:hypothetical protein Tco_0371661 [Tanacetum coccineum]
MRFSHIFGVLQETPYELLEDDQKKKLRKNNEAKVTLYKALMRKEYARVFMCKTTKEVWHTLIITHQGNSQVKNCKIDLLTQEYEKFSISNEETIDSGFTRFNVIMTRLKSLDTDYSSKNHVRKFLRALPMKWRSNVTAIEGAKDLATLLLDELIGNLKVYEMVLNNDGVGSKTTKEKVKSLALKAKATKEQTSDDSNSQGGTDEDINEKEADAFNLLARNFRKGNQFGCGNQFGNLFGKGRGNSFEDKGGESSKKKGACYNYKIEGRFASECKSQRRTMAFRGGALAIVKPMNIKNNITCLMAIDSKEVVSKPSSFNIDLNIIDLQMENKKLLKFNKDFTKTFEKLLKEKCAIKDKNSKLSSNINDLANEVKKFVNKEVVKPCQKYVELTQEVDSITSNISKLQNKALNFSNSNQVALL